MLPGFNGKADRLAVIGENLRGQTVVNLKHFQNKHDKFKAN